ncbi:MAG: hypothetical protein RDU89_00175 [bacterium]|nr:hypothetical protein [bacterium]
MNLVYGVCRLALAALAFLFLITLAAYEGGKRAGRAHGLSQGRALARLEAREEALERGRCPLCGKPG